MGGTIRVRCYRCNAHRDAARGDEVCPGCGRPWKYYVLIFNQAERIWVGADRRGQPLRTWEHADQVLSAIRYEITIGVFDPGRYIKRIQAKYQFPEALKLYWEHEEIRVKAGDLRPWTLKTKRYQMKAIVPMAGAIDIRDVQKIHLETWRMKLLDKIAPTGVAAVFRVIRHFFSWALDVGLIDAPAHFPKISEPHRVVPWMDEIAQAAVMAAMDEHHRGIWLFCFTQGVRLCEAQALRWDDLDMERTEVTIRRSMDRAGSENRPKTDRERTIPLHPDVVSWLESHRGIGWVFQVLPGRPYRYGVLFRIWKQACADAGVPYVSPYQGTRHSAASQWARDGASLLDIMHTLGHTKPSTTMRYAHPSLMAGRRTILRKETQLREVRAKAAEADNNSQYSEPLAKKDHSRRE